MTDVSRNEKAITRYTKVYIKLDARITQNKQKTLFSLWSLNKNSTNVVLSRGEKINSNNNNIDDGNKTNNKNNKIMVIAIAVVIIIIILLLPIILTLNNNSNNNCKVSKNQVI